MNRHGTPPAGLLSLDRACLRRAGGEVGPFDLTVAAGERIAVLGPSGAGKSTLLGMLSGERAPTEGVVSLGGRSVTTGVAGSWPLADLARHRAVLPQSHQVAFGLPVEAVVALGRVARRADPQLAQVVDAALALANAAHLRGRRIDTLSGGEQARVQLARVFAQLWHEQGGLLLLDEPLSALDPGLQLELLDVIRRFARRREHALIAVLHDVNQALSSFKRLWLVRDGALVADVPSGRAAVPLLEALYGVTLRCVERPGDALAVVPERRSGRVEALC